MTREDQLKMLKKTLDAPRLQHSIAVEQVAVQLAKRFGADVRKASQAGLLHDCAKNCSMDRMEELVNSTGEQVDDITRASRALMHAPAGAVLARTAYGEDDPEVLHAIRVHTTACAQMSTLDKIIYMADMIEPGRKNYPGLDEIRTLAQTDLDAALLEALKQSEAYVLEKRQQLHPDTQAAYQALRSKYQEEN